MKFRILAFIFSLHLITTFAQVDSVISLQIIDSKICYNKKTSALNFSYFFENLSDQHWVVVDYYEPCIWENPSHKHDTSQTKGLYLQITDDSGYVFLPKIELDSTLGDEKFSSDSARFFESYDRTRNKDYHFHTRSLRPHDVLINLYNVKLNKRKCFYKTSFVFDYARKYKVSMHYLSRDDLKELVNRSAISQDDTLFIGELKSNEVDLCFK